MASKDFPFTIEPLPEPENSQLKEDFHGYCSGAVRVGPHGYLFQGIYQNYAPRYYNFQVFPTDVFVASYPKSGTTWTQEMVWLLIHDLDYEGAKFNLDERFPFIEADHVLDAAVFQRPEIRDKLSFDPPKPGDWLKKAVTLPHPRSLKTHMPFSLLTPSLLDTCKVIYVARDPRDVVVSYYHHHRMWPTHGYIGNFKTFFRYFLDEKVMWSPFWSHIREAWELRDHHNLLILTYHDLLDDLKAVITKVAGFLGKTVSVEQLETLEKHLQFDSMKKNPATNASAQAEVGLLDTKEGGFIRKGGSGGWCKYFDNQMVEEFQAWMVKEGKGLEKEFKWLL